MTESAPPALARLRAGEPVCGLAQTFVLPQITELAVWSGFDFVMLDCEHGVADEAAHLACLAAAQGHDLFVAVRLRRGDLAAVGRYADWGADALLMPDLCSAQDAQAFASAALPGPAGSRSSASITRARRFGLDRAMPAPLLLGMIESAAGIAEIDAIAASGVDGLVIGPSDLSADLGVAGQFEAEEYRSAFERVERAARDHRLVLGSKIHPPFEFDRLIEGGHRFILATSDIAVLAAGFRSATRAKDVSR